MRITGFVTINGSREWLDWTLTGGSIVEGPGLSAAEITYEGTIEAPLEEEAAPTDGYENLTVTELKVQLTQRELPIYGNKEQLIERMRAWDAENPEGYTPPVVVTEEASATDDASEGELAEAEAEAGDEVVGSESE